MIDEGRISMERVSVCFSCVGCAFVFDVRVLWDHISFSLKEVGGHWLFGWLVGCSYIYIYIYYP